MQYFTNRKTCPLCKGIDNFTLLRLPYTGKLLKDYLVSYYPKCINIFDDLFNNIDYKINKCNNCNLIYQEIVPNEILLNIIYDDWLVNDHITLPQKSDNKLDLFFREAKLVEFLLKDKEKLKLLDFGMGKGNYVNFFSSIGYDIDGLEFSPELVERARKKGLNAIYHTDLESNKYDFINTEQVFEHLEKPNEVLCSLIDSLKVNGIIKISVPTSLNINNSIENLDFRLGKKHKLSLNPIAPLEHLNLFSKETFKKIEQLFNLKMVKIPILYQYNQSYNWFSRDFLRNAVTPLSNNFIHIKNYYFFQKV